ncbi:MerR family transcriptional regulator [Nocardioides sp. YIM 152315]|uniref:MerR family transcriptional regulator n=1 Tax=Nocardioides sp. YIM 152315 TaxID=3031760 RepID=UPI0023DCD0B4|nr:MerR family transcriptional regulator [Nocardioides sp. YIM 152315]MDF1603795.1 MerR family transcriptional regulator [Nocardioides sp. YIM 152315]
MNGLLSIGDFSRMTFLTVKALRHYHDVGLLEPARIDPHSGYRLYRPEQVAPARLIRRLRDLDLPVDDVRAVLDAPDDESRNAVIVAHLDRMSRQLRETQETVDSLRRLLSGDEERLAVVRRDEAAVLTLAIRGVVGGDVAVSWWLEAFAELHRALRTSGAERAGPDGAVFPTEFFTEGSAEVVVFVPVTSTATVGGRVEVVERPAGRYAVATYDGPMVDLDGAYSVLGRTVTEQALAADGPVVERYLPLGDEGDLLDHATEVCWPVRR